MLCSFIPLQKCILYNVHKMLGQYVYNKQYISQPHSNIIVINCLLIAKLCIKLKIAIVPLDIS